VATFKEEEEARPPCGETTKADAVERKKAGRNNFMVIKIMYVLSDVDRIPIVRMFYPFDLVCATEPNARAQFEVHSSSLPVGYNYR
jgi:hypothetical protein